MSAEHWSPIRMGPGRWREQKTGKVVYKDSEYRVSVMYGHVEVEYNGSLPTSHIAYADFDARTKTETAMERAILHLMGGSDD